MERAVLGGGDTLLASAWLSSPIPEWLRYKVASRWLQVGAEWVHEHGGCSFIEGTIVHEWHGDFKDRSYVKRHALLEELDLDQDIVCRDDGVLEFSANVPDSVRDKVLLYFIERFEDGP